MPRASITPEILTKARALIAKGHSPTQAAAKLGVGKSQLYERLKASPVTRGVTPPQSLQGPEGAPSPAIGADDNLAIIEGELTAARNAREQAATDKEWLRIPVLSRLVVDLVKERRKMAPPTGPTAEELEAKARPDADSVLAKIEDGVKSNAKYESKTCICQACGAALSSAQVAERRLLAGEDPPPLAVDAPEDMSNARAALLKLLVTRLDGAPP